MPLTELTGTLRRERWRPPDAGEGNSFVIADLEDGTSIKGDAPLGDLVPGLPYKFVGNWDATAHPKFGKAFNFSGYIKAEPHSRIGVIKYLTKYAPGVGPQIAGILYDCYGTDAVKRLRNDPELACEDVNNKAKRGIFSDDAAWGAGVALKELSLLEDTRIDLANLLNGRGFPGRLTEEIIRRWGPFAPVRIRRDPFSLMVLDMPGCSFGRCDKLYCDLGLPPGRTKRQMLCLWRSLKDDGNGHTWLPLSWAEKKLREKIAGAPVKLERALKLGIRSGWLAEHLDGRGQRWVAQAEAAEAERTVVESVAALSKWELPEACGTATPADYATWLGLHGRGFVREYYGTDQIPDGVPGVSDISTEQKVRIGRDTGVCQFCARTLINPESMARGYGPTCGERNNLPV